MKTMFPVVRLTLCLAAACLGFSACQKNAEDPSASETEAASATPPPVAATATPAPEAAPAATPAPATPPPPQLAPEGVYFLVRPVTVATEEGVTGLKPGTRAVRQPDGRYLADGHTVELRPEQLTNDLRVAAQVSSADQAAQNAIRKSLAPASPAPGTSAREASPPAEDSASDAIAAKRAQIKQRRTAVRTQIDRLQTELGRLSNTNPRTSPAAARLNREIDALQEEDRQLRAQSSALR